MKKFIRIYVRFVQKILITILLTLLYVFVFGLTKCIVLLFHRKKNKHLAIENSYWLKAEHYNNDFEAALEQS